MQWKSETKFSRPLATSGKEDARVGRGTSRHGLACVFPDRSDVVDGFCREAKRDTKTKHCDANSVTALVVGHFLKEEQLWECDRTFGVKKKESLARVERHENLIYFSVHYHARAFPNDPCNRFPNGAE